MLTFPPVTVRLLSRSTVLPALVLMEGRRFADDATVALGAGLFSDVSIFWLPSSAELKFVKDVASAQCGSEAVGEHCFISFLKE